MILVDDIQEWPSGKWCHMVSDTSLDELHAMAERLGLKREWYQCRRKGNTSRPHYDLRPSKRELARRLGAQPVDSRELVQRSIYILWKLRCLSLTQPWATLVAILAKRIETRNWSTSYRGPLGIHAAKGLGPVGGKRGLLDLCCTEPFLSVLQSARNSNAPGQFYADEIALSLPLGAIVAVCELVGCEPAAHYKHFRGVSAREAAFGDYSDGRYAWLLANIRALPEPVPCGGHQRLWELDIPEGLVIVPPSSIPIPSTEPVQATFL